MTGFRPSAPARPGGTTWALEAVEDGAAVVAAVEEAVTLVEELFTVDIDVLDDVVAAAEAVALDDGAAVEVAAVDVGVEVAAADVAALLVPDDVATAAVPLLVHPLTASPTRTTPIPNRRTRLGAFECMVAFPPLPTRQRRAMWNVSRHRRIATEM